MKLDFIKKENLEFLKRDKKVKREREKHITRLHLILFGLILIIIVIVVVTVKVNKDKRIAKYEKLEKELYTASTYYYSEKSKEIEKGQIRIIPMSEIIKNGYLQDEATNKCNGYTIVGNYRNPDGSSRIVYESYIKCGNDYMTVDYNEEYLK